MPADAKIAGRIFRIENLDDQSLRWTLQRDGKLHQVQFAEPPLYSQFLVEGDVVAVKSATEFVLLAPQKSSLPNRTYNSETLEQWNHYLENLRGFLELKTLSKCARQVWWYVLEQSLLWMLFRPP